jgi:PhnB protein
MSQINAYLTFAGNCRDAMNFYKSCLGGELYMQTVGETAMAGRMPPETHALVMHSSLSNGSLVLMASDMMADGEGVVQGNATTLMLQCGSETEIKECFSKLSAGGKVNAAVKEEFWGSLFGDLTDKFGHRWMLNYDKPKA